MNILVTFDLPPELVGRIEAVSPTVHVRVLGLGERDAFIAREGRLPFPSEIQACTPAGDIEGALPEADVLFAYWGTALVGLQDLRERAPRLRWVQLTHVGAEQVAPSLLASDIIFTSAVGLASTPIAEMVLAYMLMFAKGWPRLWRDQRTRNYWRLTPGTLAGKTVGIVGMGSIGAEVARLVRPFGCRVVGTRRSLSERVRGEADGDEVVPASELHYLLAASDYVVICAPLTADTKGMIDGRALASMRADAVLINIARGELVVESALVEALQSRRIRGAALDVFEQEPLPASSPLWDLDNVILTPHISGGTERYFEIATSIFCANLERYLAGAPLRHVVDATRGY